MTGSLTAWRDLWRSAPVDVQQDTVRLVLMTPAIAYAFALLWTMLPS